MEGEDKSKIKLILFKARIWNNINMLKGSKCPTGTKNDQKDELRKYYFRRGY